MKILLSTVECREPAWFGFPQKKKKKKRPLPRSIDVRLRELDLFEMTQKSVKALGQMTNIDESQPQFASSPSSFVPTSYDETSVRGRKEEKKGERRFHYLRIFWRGWLTIWNPLPSSAATPPESPKGLTFFQFVRNIILPMQWIISFFFSSIAVVGSLLYRPIARYIFNWIVVYIVF